MRESDNENNSVQLSMCVTCQYVSKSEHDKQTDVGADDGGGVIPVTLPAMAGETKRCSFQSCGIQNDSYNKKHTKVVYDHSIRGLFFITLTAF